MREINKYIFEKLKINKNSKLNTIDNYHVGDVCLNLIYIYDLNNVQKCIVLSISKIFNIDKNTIKFLSYNDEEKSWNDPSKFSPTVFEKINDYKYLYNDYKAFSIIILPPQESKKVLNQIKENKYIDYGDFIGEKIYNIPVKKVITDSNVISNNELKNIENILDENN